MATVLEEPFPLKMEGDVLIFPAEGLPLMDKDFDEGWAARTRYVLDHFPDAESRKLTTYNPLDIKNRQQAARNAVSHLKNLATKELVVAIATEFTNRGINTFKTVDDFENTFKIMKTAQFDNDYTTHEYVLKLLYEIVVATWKFRVDWKVTAIDTFCTDYKIDYEGDLEKQGSNGVKGNYCFLNIVNAAPVRSVRDKFEAAMEKVFDCCIKVQFGVDRYGWGELDINLKKSGRCAEVAPVRYKSKSALMIKPSKAEEKKTKAKNDKTYDNTVTKLACVAVKLLYPPDKVSSDVQTKMNELTANGFEALPIPSVSHIQGTQLTHQLLPSAMAASTAAASASQIYHPSSIQHPIQQQNVFGGMSLLKPPSPIQGKQTQPAPVAAPSLQLRTLDLQRNNITRLKLMVNVSSIKSTYNSNNTLSSFKLAISSDPTYNEMKSLIYGACSLTRDALYLNRRSDNSREAVVGRAKVIRYHLNSQSLKKLCQLQGIEYIHGNIFADIEPVLLHRILALIGDRHGQSELYTALILTAPDLLSYIDRRAMLNDVLAKNTAHMAALAAEYEQKIATLKANFLTETSRLTAHNDEVSNRLELIELGDKNQSSNGEGERYKEVVGNSKKRQRRYNRYYNILCM